jgi:hypothetical protein
LIHAEYGEVDATVLNKWLMSPKLAKAPPITTFTYHYTAGPSVLGTKVGVNLFAKILPDKALQTLWDIHPWEVHIGGDDLLHARPNGAPREADVFYSPFVARPHLQYPSIFKDKRHFYFQPQPYQAATNTHGSDVFTMLEHCGHLAKGMMDTVKRSGGSVGGWIVLPSYDHHINATNYLSCQSVPFIRDIKRYIKHVVMFSQVQFVIPCVKADGTLTTQMSRQQLQNQWHFTFTRDKGARTWASL